MKFYLKLAFQNIFRSKRRSILSIISIAVAVMVIILARGWVSGLISDMINNTVYMDTGHIKVLNADFFKKKKFMPLYHNVYGYADGGYQTLVDHIRGQYPKAKAVLPRTRFSFLLSHNDKNTACFGMALDPDLEKDINPILKSVVNGKLISNRKTPNRENKKFYYEIMIGDGLADMLDINVGDRMTLMTQTAEESLGAMTFQVAGIFNFGVKRVDDKFIFIPIAAAQEMLKMPKSVTEILLIFRGHDHNKLNTIGRELNEAVSRGSGGRYIALPWFKQSDLFAMYSMAETIYFVIYIVLVALASLVVMNTMMMVVMERMKEIGTLRALGMKGGDVVITFMFEAFFLSLFGSGLGAILGSLLLRRLEQSGVDMAKLTGAAMEMGISNVIYPQLTAAIVASAVLLGVIFTTLVSYLPTRQAAKMDPAKALRSI